MPKASQLLLMDRRSERGHNLWCKRYVGTLVPIRCCRKCGGEASGLGRGLSKASTPPSRFLESNVLEKRQGGEALA
eukprot:10329513-Prorocentrum_lima.AAC.1